MFDSIIIGAGVSGCAIARELSKRKGKFLVIEKDEDVCSGTSKANSGIVHSGFDAPTGTNKAKMNVEGARLFPQWAKELDFPYARNGAVVFTTTEEGLEILEELKDQGIVNGVEGLAILNREEILNLEPNISDDVKYALRASSSGITDPFLFNIALAENAYTNGVEFKFNEKVIDIKQLASSYVITTDKGEYETRTIANAAGLYADDIHHLVRDDDFKIIPRSGEYYLLDKSLKGYVRHTIFQLPTKMGKGVLVTPAIDGNIIIGPTSIDRDSKEDLKTTREGLDEIKKVAEKSIKNLPFRENIVNFTGLRAHGNRGDFVIEEVPGSSGFFDVAGIESPGLASAPAIGMKVSNMITDFLKLEENEDFNPNREGIFYTKNCSLEELNEKIKENPQYGHMVCRCENVTEGEIVEAILRPLGARSLDGLKRRTRAGAGRCQGGFCTPLMIRILARELNLEPEDIAKNKKGSEFIIGRTK